MLESFFSLPNSGSVWVIMAIIFFGSYLIEDAAVIFAAWVAATGELSIALAFISIFLGILTGDLLLYLIGRSAHRWTWLRDKLLSFEQLEMVKQMFERNYFWNVAFVRFLPGMRSTSYSLCGFWGLGITIFVLSATLITMVWTVFIFGIITFLGKEFFEDTYFMWVLPLFVLGLLFIINRRAVKRLQRMSVEHAKPGS